MQPANVISTSATLLRLNDKTEQRFQGRDKV